MTLQIRTVDFQIEDGLIAHVGELELLRNLLQEPFQVGLRLVEDDDVVHVDADDEVMLLVLVHAVVADEGFEVDPAKKLLEGGMPYVAGLN